MSHTFCRSRERTALPAMKLILLLVVQFGTQPGCEPEEGVLCDIGVGVGSMGVPVSIGPPPPSKCFIGTPGVPLPWSGVGVGDEACCTEAFAESEVSLLVAPEGVAMQGCVVVAMGVGCIAPTVSVACGIAPTVGVAC